MQMRSALSWLLLALLSAFGGVASAISAQTVEDPLPIVANSVRMRLVAAGRQVLVLALAGAQDTAPVCAAFIDSAKTYRASPIELRELNVGHRLIVARTACPRTYVSMIAGRDADGRSYDSIPSGHVDPRYLELVIPDGQAPEREALEVRVVQGTRTDVYSCSARRQRDVPVCHLILSGLSSGIPRSFTSPATPPRSASPPPSSPPSPRRLAS
jgi:hypothetical protein